MAEKKSFNNMVRSVVRFVEYRVVHVDDTPHRLALGMGLGLCVAWMPAVGLHVVMILALTFLFRANKFIGFTAVWISNPLTFVPIYYPSYLVGKTVFQFFDGSAAGSEAVLEASTVGFPSLGAVTDLFSVEFWREVFSFFLEIGPELWVGGLIIGTVAGVAGYFITYRFIVWHREHHPRRKHKPV